MRRERFQSSGWECQRILEGLDRAENFYFDRVSQIQMEPQNGLWTRDRVTLVGDAAFCISLLAGQGSALAMTGAYILAGELHRARGDYVAAFAEYQRRFGAFIRKKQQAALRFALALPQNQNSPYSFAIKFSASWRPWVVDLVAGGGMVDHIELPEY